MVKCLVIPPNDGLSVPHQHLHLILYGIHRVARRNLHHLHLLPKLHPNKLPVRVVLVHGIGRGVVLIGDGGRVTRRTVIQPEAAVAAVGRLRLPPDMAGYDGAAEPTRHDGLLVLFEEIVSRVEQGRRHFDVRHGRAVEDGGAGWGVVGVGVVGIGGLEQILPYSPAEFGKVLGLEFGAFEGILQEIGRRAGRAVVVVSPLRLYSRIKRKLKTMDRSCFPSFLTYQK